jgi:hypothetical protein
MSNSLADVTVGLESFMSSSFFFMGIMFVILGLFSLGTILKTDSNPDDYMASMFKGMISFVIGASLIGSNLNSDTFNLLKYLGIGAAFLIVAAIVFAITMFMLDIKKYRNYIKKTNELLLLTDDFLILSSHLQTIEEQIELNTKMTEALTSKKKEELTFLNRLLDEKRIRFNGMVAEVRASISL